MFFRAQVTDTVFLSGLLVCMEIFYVPISSYFCNSERSVQDNLKYVIIARHSPHS